MEKKFLQLSLLSLFIIIFSQTSYSQEQIPTDVFGSPPLVGTVKISPNGTKIAIFATMDNGDSAILVRDLTKNEPLRPIVSSDNKSLKLLGYYWFSEDIILARAWLSADYFNTKIDYTKLLRVNVDGSGFKPLFKNRHFKDLPFKEPNQTRITDFLSEDEDHILVQLRTTNYRSPDVVKLNIKKNTIDVIQKSKTHVQNWITDEDGNIRAGFKYDRRADICCSVIFKDINTGKWRTIWKYANFSEDEVSVLGFGKDPNKVWFTAYHEGRLAVFSTFLNRPNLEPKLVYSHPSRDVEGGLRYKKGLKDPIGINFRDDNYHLVTWNEEEANFEQSIYKLFPDKEVYFGTRSENGNRYILFVENSSTPGSYYLGDRDKGTLELIADSYPKLANIKLPSKKTIVYQARDGLSIEAFLTLPEGKANNLPTIIFPHGGPIAADAAQGFDYWTSFFANRGYAVLQMNFRGSTGYGFDFMKAGLGQWGKQMQFDVEDATKWAISEGIADPNRICIVGGSYGGYAALMGVATSDLYQCAVSFAGVTDVLDLYDSSRRYGGSEVLKEMLGDDRSKLREVSPVNLASQIQVPVLLVQGEDDSRVLLKHGTRMRDALEEAGVPHKYIQQVNSDHFLTLKVNRLQFFEETERFLSIYLNN